MLQLWLLSGPLPDADDGELTRPRKVRRRIIEDKFADIITALYDGSDSVFTETEVTYEDGRKGAISATLSLVDADVAAVAQAAVDSSLVAVQDLAAPPVVQVELEEVLVSVLEEEAWILGGQSEQAFPVQVLH